MRPEFITVRADHPAARALMKECRMKATADYREMDQDERSRITVERLAEILFWRAVDEGRLPKEAFV